MDFTPSFAPALKQHRTRLALTQQQLAQRVGCALVTIQRMEQGTLRPSLQIAHRLADLFGLAAAEREYFVHLARAPRMADAAVAPPQTEDAAAARASRSRLPAPLTPLLGRASEVAAVCDALKVPAVRLVTLTGPGGIGKTRLALEVAANLAADFADGAVFVDLAPLTDPALVAPAIAQALGVREMDGRSLQATLERALRDRRQLLLLDNFEHVVAAAPLVADLLEAAPHVKALLTTRVVVGIYGEQLVDVPPLSYPDPAHLPPVHQVLEYPAVRLFVERARALCGAFVVGESDAAAVAAICQRLDGLPLAIELAASHVRLFPPRTLLARLGQRLPLLTRGARTLPHRQQTLRATIDWSYSLLDAAEQLLWRRLAVFVGGASLEAAEAVCNADGVLRLTVADGLQSLLDKSLLRQTTGVDGDPRFTMLETMHEYAIEQLDASGEAEALKRRHADYFVALGEAAEPALRGPGQMLWLQRLQIEHDNLRAALRCMLTTGQAEGALRLSGALVEFWLLHGHWREGRRWVQATLEAAEPVLTSAWAKAVYASGTLAYHCDEPDQAQRQLTESIALFRKLGMRHELARGLVRLADLVCGQGNGARAKLLCEEALTLFEALGDKQGAAYALGLLGWVHYAAVEHVQASAYFEASLALAREIEDTWLIAWALHDLGMIAADRGDPRQATALLSESITLRRTLGDSWGTAVSLAWLGLVSMAQGDYATARALNEERLRLEQHVGNPYCIADSLLTLGAIALHQGDFEGATTGLDESLARFQEVGDLGGVADALLHQGWMATAQGEYARAAAYFRESLMLGKHGEKPGAISHWLAGVAVLASEQGQPRSAAKLFGAALALRDMLGARMDARWRIPYVRTYEQHLARVRSNLDPSTFAAAWSEGQAMPQEAVLAYALKEMRCS